MDDQNKGLKERWGQPGHVPERGYAGSDPETERQTREIRSDIAQTRADMSETVDAIQEKLRPGNIVSRATSSVRDATVDRVKEMARGARDTFRGDSRRTAGISYGVTERIRENPIPVAIAAASLAWIAFSGRRPRRSPAIYGSTRGGEAFIRETTISEYGDPDEDVAVASEYGARDAGQRMRRATSTARGRVQQFVRENPLAAGVIAAAVGATVGVALPETQRENELMGEARDAVVDRAQEAARGAAERVKDAARQVQDVATEAAKKVTGDE